jgi:pyrroloquinoline quinone (PQQ) biosynthesis protein C
MLYSGIVCRLQSDVGVFSGMSKAIRWMPHLTTLLGWGSETSRFLHPFRDENALTMAHDMCLELWPLVEELPVNIAHVFNAVPDELEAAKKLFGDLADEERFYQRLFLNQCELFGIPLATLESHKPSEAAIHVKRVVGEYCQSDNWENAVLAITTAELACTAFCRVAVELYEEYFSKQGDRFSEQQVTDGMEWIRLHARPQTRNALLLLRTLSQLTSAGQIQLPEPSERVAKALLAVWQCPLEAYTSTVSGAGSGSVDNAFVA